eukprot:6437755-Pyramimonas_sp.AAC.1
MIQALAERWGRARERRGSTATPGFFLVVGGALPRFEAGGPFEATCPSVVEPGGPKMAQDAGKKT